MINRLYLEKNVLEQIRARLENDGFVRLENFFEKEDYKRILNLLENSIERKVKIPDKYSYTKIKIDGLFNDEEFNSFFGLVLGKGKLILEAKKFSHGDYTVIHDENDISSKKRLFLFFSKDWKKEYGGNRIYFKNKRPIIFPVVGNCLNLFLGDSKNFVKYVNCLAGRKSFIMFEGTIE